MEDKIAVVLMSFVIGFISGYMASFRSWFLDLGNKSEGVKK